MSSVQKTSLLVGILIIIGGGAFVYFDPLDLDLLGLKQKPAAAKPAAEKHIAMSAAEPLVIAPKAVVPQTQTKASVAAPSPAPSPAAVPAATPAATPSVVETAQAPQPPMKLSQETKTVSKPAPGKPERPKNLDLRHCLGLETDAAIAKCAGE